MTALASTYVYFPARGPYLLSDTLVSPDRRTSFRPLALRSLPRETFKLLVVGFYIPLLFNLVSNAHCSSPMALMAPSPGPIRFLTTSRLQRTLNGRDALPRLVPQPRRRTSFFLRLPVFHCSHMPTRSHYPTSLASLYESASGISEPCPRIPSSVVIMILPIAARSFSPPESLSSASSTSAGFHIRRTRYYVARSP